MAGQLKLLAGPAYVASSATNILAAPSTGYLTVRHIHLANVTASSATVSLYLGATGGSAGGTELFKTFTIAANSSYDYWCAMVMSTTAFLSGICETGASKVTVIVEGEASISSA